MLEIYYIFGTVSYGNTLKAELTSYGSFLAARRITIYSVFGILFLVVIAMVVVPIQKKLERFNSSVYIFPFDLIDENM